MTLKLDDSRCRIHSIYNGPSGPGALQGPHGNDGIVTNQKYVVMPWKMVARHGTNMTLKEVVEEIKAHKEDRKLVCRFEAEHRDEILELIDCIDKGCIEERIPEIYKFGPERLGIHLKDKFILEDHSSGYPIKRSYNQLDYFKKLITAYNGYDSDVIKYVKKVEAFTDKPLNELELEYFMAIRKKVKFPRKLNISVFYKLTGRLPHEKLEYDYERIIIHFYDTFVAASIKLLGKTIRCRTNVLYHLLKKIGKEPNADLFPFMKGDSHQQTEEEIKFIFGHLVWFSYSPVPPLTSH